MESIIKLIFLNNHTKFIDNVSAIKKMKTIASEKMKENNMFFSLLYISLITIIIMTIYEATKQELLPKLTLWESHTITILFTGLTAPFAAYFVIKKIFELKNKLAIELIEKEKAYNQLNELNEYLEHKVEARTRELSDSYNKLSEEVACRQKAEEQQKLDELKYRILFEQSPFGILVYDTKLKITQANKKIKEELKEIGYNFEELDLNNLKTEKLKNAFLTGLTGVPDYYEGELTTMNEHKVYALVKINPMFDKKGRIIGGLASIENITKRKEFENALLLAKENAEKSALLKSEFLAQISHEIRTPINSILSFSSLIKSEVEEMVDKETKEGFNVIEKQGFRIIRTMDLILNMAELQQNIYEPNFREINLLEEIISKMKSTIELDCNKKKLWFYIINELENNISVIADCYSLSQIFQNLLDNAVKYTEKGGVILRIKKNNFKLIVEIEDTGIGISKDYLEKLFGVFSQEEQGYSRKYEGNGLGLALVKGYCDLNKIDIKFESTKNIGTKVILSF